MDRYLLLAPSLMVFLALVVTFSHADTTINDHLPGGPIGPLGTVDESYKFDDGFYERIQEMINVAPSDGVPNVHDGKIYHDVIFVVSKDDGDNRNPDLVAAENKKSLVKMLNDTGALNIKPAKILSFVTASVPVVALPGLSLHDEILKLGDGTVDVVSEVDTARITTHATDTELRGMSGTVLNGSGVMVGVIDTGINHPTALNDKVLKRALCNADGCNPTTTATVDADPRIHTFTTTSHGTQVAQVLAASGLPIHNGSASGVHLLDADHNGASSSIPHALDWLLQNGADVVNMSLFMNDLDAKGVCAVTDPSVHNLIVNEAVDKGMVVVKSAGNQGHGYSTITSPGCSHNVITVGGINDRTPNAINMYNASSRGPVTDDRPRLKPDLVAPAENIQTLTYVHNTATHPRSGTSYAAPQVSAAAALLLQAKPDLTPIEIKAAILLGADWQAPIPCSSVQFETDDSNDPCSHAMTPTNENDADVVVILNNVGFGILNINRTLEYASERTPVHNHVIGGYLDADTSSREYTFKVTDTSESAKIILTWFAHPHGGITEQYRHSDPADPVDLGFSILMPNGLTINADSDYQTNEFAVFNPPSAGTYTVTVTGSGLDSMNKPIQNYALASTHSLAILPTSFLNRAPVAHADTIIINPHDEEPAIVRLTGTDQNGDSISFSVSRDPLHGTASTDEQITKTSSRMLYNASSSFGIRDSFEITPQDGMVTGTPTVIIIRAESLPPGSDGSATLNSSMVKKWDTLEVRHGYTHTKYSSTWSGPGYPVSAIYLGSVNMEGVDARVTTTSGTTYTAAVPPSGDRMITLTSPLSIRSVALSADGLDEESAHDNTKEKSPAPRKSEIHSAFIYDDVRMFVGYVPASCTGGTLSGAQSSSSSCPAYTAYTASSAPSLDVPDNTRTQSVSDTILVPVNGTLRSLSVSLDISHSYTGDLKVKLSSPSGRTVSLHDRTGGGTDDIKKTYGSATTLAPLLGSATAGNWTVTVGDYMGGDVGTLKSWSISAQYEPAVVHVTPNNNGTAGTARVTVFSDDFESGTLAKWTETGEGDWTVSTSRAHSAPTLPGRVSSNMVLHSDNCDSSCTVTTKEPIDLSGYTGATLSFWRFIDYGFDGDEYLRVDVSPDGSSWETAFHWSPNANRGDDNKWHNESYDMSRYAGKSSVAIRFVTQQSSISEDVQVDDVVVSATTGAKKPAQSNNTGPVTPPAASHSIYIADTDDYEILVYASTGAYQGDIVSRKSGGLGKPFDVAFGPDGHMYVSDNTYNKIRKYNGSTGAPLGTTAASAEWASTNGIPNGMAWNGNTLYVATLRGVEKISLSGSNLGYFGDASKTPFGTGIPRLVSPYDVAFCPDGHMYVADRSLDKILYYDNSTGKYKGIISDTPSATQPDMDEAAGLKCGPAVAGRTGTVSLFQSGEDAGWVNEINLSTKKLVRQFASLIDEPYGMDFDAAGNLYVANKDDDNIIRISTAGTSAVFATGSMDDPRGVAVGPKYITSSSANSENTKPVPQDNNGPEPVLQNGTAPSPLRMIIAAGAHIVLDVTAADPEGDPVALDVIPYAIPPATVTLIDHKNGTGIVSINTSGLPPDTYAFMITAHDGQNLERVMYTVVVP